CRLSRMPGMLARSGIVAVVRVTTLARFVLLISLTGGAPQWFASLGGDQLCGRCSGTVAAVSVVAGHGSTVGSAAFRENTRLNFAARPSHFAPGVPSSSLHLVTVDSAGACLQRRRASGQSAVCSPAALRGPPVSA